MTTAVQRRRGTNTEHASFTGLEGEISVNTTNESVHVHDGSTAGGFELMRADGSNSSVSLGDITGVTAGTGLSGGGTSGDVTLNIDSTVATLAGTQTFTNKTLTSPILNTPTIGTSFTIGGATITEAELEILDGATLSTTELNYVDGVTSSIQTQIDAKAPIASPTFTGTVTIPTADINAGSIDGTAIGASSASTGAFTTLTATGLTVDTNTLYVDSTNNRVGIGTTSPSDTLSVNGQIGFFGNDGQLKFNDGSAIKGGNNYGDIRIQTDRFRVYNEAGSNLAMNIDSSGNVGIGTSLPVSKLDAVLGSTSRILLRERSSRAYIDSVTETNSAFDSLGINGSEILFETGGTERARIDSSGNLLVGKTSAAGQSTAGIEARGDGVLIATKAGTVQYLNRTGSDGTILNFAKDGSTVGSINSVSGDSIAIGTGDTGLRFSDTIKKIHPYDINSGTNSDNVLDLGDSNKRFDDIYATNGTIQTSDRNEKQDIAELSDAEQRVAVACKGLLRKFRWKDSVAEKGDDARIHFGIIAQDLQAAFEAEGLDAGDYAMFISTTWTDEETNEEKTRLGVRYSELLAFIISAI